jgi:hypothetical protein
MTVKYTKSIQSAHIIKTLEIIDNTDKSLGFVIIPLRRYLDIKCNLDADSIIHPKIILS